jgi:hypothetical protein
LSFDKKKRREQILMKKKGKKKGKKKKEKKKGKKINEKVCLRKSKNITLFWGQSI